jgi:hypothetical protein
MSYLLHHIKTKKNFLRHFMEILAVKYDRYAASHNNYYLRHFKELLVVKYERFVASHKNYY